MILETTSSHQHGNVILIIAGYPDVISDFLKANPGIGSRFRHLYLHDYSPEEMLLIFDKMCAAQQYELTPEARSAFFSIFQALHDKRKAGFGNAREVRVIFHQSLRNHASRMSKITEPTPRELKTITIDDIPYMR